MTLLIPYNGIRIFQHTDKPIDINDPKGGGTWMAITQSLVAFYDAFATIGILSDAGTGGALPKDTLTIYFGPPREDESQPTGITKSVEQAKYHWLHPEAIKRR